MKEITKESILEILNLIIENYEITDSNIDENLIQLGMDSIVFIQLIVALEKEFEVEIPDAYLQLKEMDTVNKIFKVLSSIS